MSKMLKKKFNLKLKPQLSKRKKVSNHKSLKRKKVQAMELIVEVIQNGQQINGYSIERMLINKFNVLYAFLQAF